MAKNIFEELPARKHAPAKAAPAAAKGGDDKGGREGGDGSEKKIRQAVYDIRYRARREGIDLRAAYSQYMSNSNLTAPEQAAVRAKLFGKDGGGDKKESYDALMADGATTSVANAMFKVFVEKTVQEEVIQEDETSEKKYKVRVTDPKSERTYVRYADREKITALRAKGLKVEMTEHGDPYEGKKKEVPNKGGLDKPVAPSKRDGDVNDDGKKDGTDKYIYNRRDAINKAIERKKGMKEEFLADATTSTEGQNKGKITGTGVDNSKLIKVNPESEADVHRTNRKGLYAHADMEISSSRTRLLEMIAEKKKADACAHNGKGEECGVHGMKACPDTEVKEEKEEKKEDTRANKTYRDLLKNKMRSAGMNVFAACGDEDKLEDSAMKAMTAAFVRPGEDGKMKMVSLYDKGDSSKMKKEDYERSPEANAAKQEEAKKEAQKKREAAAKPKSDIEREGAAQREVERKGKARMGAALRRNPDLFKGL